MVRNYLNFYFLNFLIFLGSDIKNNNNIEFRYSEPKKLQEIEKFFIEFFLSIRNNFDIFHDTNHELNYLDYSIISTINDILVTNKQSLNGSNNSIETILNKINKKLYENYINMQNGSENIVKNHNNENENKRNSENEIQKDKENNKDSTNYLKINKLNILKELFNTFEIFNKSEYENANSKNLNNSENDGWIFKKETNENKNHDDKLPSNLNRFDRFNSNLNTVKDEQLKNENFGENNNKKTGKFRLKKKTTNGSNMNDTVVDLKNKKNINNEFNTITFSRIENNESIKDEINRGKLNFIFYLKKIFLWIHYLLLIKKMIIRIQLFLIKLITNLK